VIGMAGELDEVIEAVNRTARRIERSEQNRRRLLADVAHELRTPLATLAAYVEGLEDGVATLDAETSDILKAQTARLSRLTEDLAAISTADEPEPSLRLAPTRPEELVRAAVASVARRFDDKGVALAGAAAPELPTVEVDADRIGQVLGNLLDNALRHTPGGGRVTVLARVAPSTEQAGIERAGVELVVEDSGEGVAARDLARIFDRFYRVEPARNGAADHAGSGIGLAIAKALVEAQDGRIRCRSAGPGHGSSFIVSLPAMAATSSNLHECPQTGG
jgi:signal transduction histidine kinase